MTINMPEPSTPREAEAVAKVRADIADMARLWNLSEEHILPAIEAMAMAAYHRGRLHAIAEVNERMATLGGAL